MIWNRHIRSDHILSFNKAFMNNLMDLFSIKAPWLHIDFILLFTLIDLRNEAWKKYEELLNFWWWKSDVDAKSSENR